MEPAGPVKIIALLGEMARCLNQNLAKVKVMPIDPAFTAPVAAAAAAPSPQTAKP